MSTPGAGSEFERRVGLFVGPRWQSAYQRKFAPFFDDASFVPTWNWSAAIFTEFWFLYRKMYLWFALFFFVPTFVLQWLWGDALTFEAVMAPENERLRLLVLAVQASTRLAAGGVANYLLFRRASTAVRVLEAQRLPAEQSLALLQRLGGTNRNVTLLLVGVFLAMTLLQFVAQSVP
jgi:hypothetical protein